MIDIHSHLLPRLDDGSRSVGQSVAALRRLAADGVTAVVLTPHLAASAIDEAAEEAITRRSEAFTQLQPHAPPEIALQLGFEILLDQPLPPLLLGDRRLSLAGSRYYLVEFPLTIVREFATRSLYEVARVGVVPLLAHPERYDACTPKLVAAWREVGAKIQVDATTLTRPTTRGHRARQLLAAGLVDVLAADNHGDGRSLRTGVEFLRRRLAGGADAHDEIKRLTVQNPEAILSDGDLQPVAPLPLGERLMERFRRFLSE